LHFATAKLNSGGFTNGDAFFASVTGIGYLSADATRSNLNWCILTNQVVTNALHLRGSLYVDRTGTFSNQLIAVASNGRSELGHKGVWRVDSLGHPTLLANLDTPHLEGVVTLTNDAQRWGAVGWQDSHWRRRLSRHERCLHTSHLRCGYKWHDPS
jgi:hypothetical protein